MTTNENKLLSMIRNHNNPEQAVEIAIQTIVEFLERLQSSQEPSPVYPRESA